MMELLSTKTVIYVTHQLEFLEASNLVLVSCSLYKKLLGADIFLSSYLEMQYSHR